jgi:hypothetical protein
MHFRAVTSWLAAALCALSAYAGAQMTQVTASSIKMAGVSVASGTVTFTPTNTGGVPISITAGGTLYDPQGFTGTITNGAISGTFLVPDACTSTPAVPNTVMVYSVQVNNTATRRSFSITGVHGVCGATWALDEYSPTQSVVIAPTGLASGTTVPSHCTSPSIFYTQTTPPTPYSCISGVYVRGTTVDPATPTAFGTVKLANGQSSTTLAKVATTGDYADLSNTPSALAVGTTAGTVAAGNDSRFQALASGVLGYATVSAMNADLAHAAGTIAQVTNDSSIALNGSYIKVGASGSGSWTQAVDRTVALGISVGQIQVGSVTTPTNNADARVNPQTRFTPNSNIPTRQSWFDTDQCATFNGYVKDFSSFLTNAEIGRTVNYYIATISGTSVTVTYDSGPVASTAAGLNTYTVPSFLSAPIAIGQCVGAYVNPVSTSNSIKVTISGGNDLGATSLTYSAGPLTLGVATTVSALPFTWWIPISATVTDHDMYVAKRWANQIGGYIAPDANGVIPPQLLPNYLGNHSQPENGANSTLESLFDPSLPNASIANTANKVRLRPTTATYTYETLPTDTVADNSYPSNDLIINWDSSAAGFTQAGMLTRVRFYPTANANAGATIQVWVLRPISLPPGTGAGQTYTFTVVAQVGEIDGSAANMYQEIAGLNIQVNAGDLLAFRPKSRGMVLSASGGFEANWRELNSASFTIPVTDMTINALVTGTSVSFTNTVAASPAQRKYLLAADIAPGPVFSVDSQPGAVLRLDNSGDIPAIIGRAVDMPWRAKKIIWVGTSIPAGSDGNGPSYPVLVGTALQANMDNEAVGSSGMIWDGTTSRCLSLMATTAQLTSVCGAGSANQSYQTKVLGKSADMLVIDHGHNDVGLPLGTITDSVVSTFYGAMNVLIAAAYADNPKMRIVLVTPPLVLDGGGTNTTAVRAAIVALGEKYQLPVIDLPTLDGFNATTYCSSGCTNYTPDGIHPAFFARQILTRILYKALTGL